MRNFVSFSLADKKIRNTERTQVQGSLTLSNNIRHSVSKVKNEKQQHKT